MFSDECFNALNFLLDNISPDNSYTDVYDASAVVDMIASLLYLQLLSDQREPFVDMTDAKKNYLRGIANTRALIEYHNRMD